MDEFTPLSPHLDHEGVDEWLAGQADRTAVGKRA
jgi:hypothetical protein